MKQIQHNGLHQRRLEVGAGNPLERVFAVAWRRENEIQAGRPIPLLVHLLSLDNYDQKAATVAATVVQWLGSPIGLTFVVDALKQCGYKVERSGG